MSTEPKPEPALHAMLKKAEEGFKKGHGRSYITYLPELREILSELTDLVAVGVFVRPDEQDPSRWIDVNITIGFTLDPDILDQTGETRK